MFNIIKYSLAKTLSRCLCFTACNYFVKRSIRKSFWLLNPSISFQKQIVIIPAKSFKQLEIATVVQAPRKLLSLETSERICSSKWSFCPWKMFQKIKHLPNIKRHLQIVFSLNAGKYGPEKTLYLDTFHAVFVMQRKMQTKCSLCPKEFKFKFLIKNTRINMHHKLQRFVQAATCLLKELTILNLRKLPVLFLTVVLVNNLYILFLVYLYSF